MLTGGTPSTPSGSSPSASDRCAARTRAPASRLHTANDLAEDGDHGYAGNLGREGCRIQCVTVYRDDVCRGQKEIRREGVPVLFRLPTHAARTRFNDACPRAAMNCFDDACPRAAMNCVHHTAPAHPLITLITLITLIRHLEADRVKVLRHEVQVQRLERGQRVVANQIFGPVGVTGDIATFSAGLARRKLSLARHGGAVFVKIDPRAATAGRAQTLTRRIARARQLQPTRCRFPRASTQMVHNLLHIYRYILNIRI